MIYPAYCLLQAFKGRTQIHDIILPGIPSAVVKLHLDDSDAEGNIIRKYLVVYFVILAYFNSNCS